MENKNPYALEIDRSSVTNMKICMSRGYREDEVLSS